MSACRINPRRTWMKVAVILSTYNAPQRLTAAMTGYAAQSHREFELVVADDGSSAETRAVVEKFAERLQRPIKHLWHEDRGFRKCRILNQAILSTNAEYCIFSDGDCVPRADFIATH